MKLSEYARSEYIENNYYTRKLTNVFKGELNDDHLKIAMEVVRRKILVGLLTKMDQSMDRAERYFKWKYRVSPENQENCRAELVSGGSNKDDHRVKTPPPGTGLYEALRRQNVYDLQLYSYVETIFEEQEALFKDTPENFRNIDATCCKCEPPTWPPEGGFLCPLNRGPEQEAN